MAIVILEALSEMLIECMSTDNIVMKSVVPAIKQYVSLYLHSKFIVLDVVQECSIVLNIVILATARFVVKTQHLMQI